MNGCFSGTERGGIYRIGFVERIPLGEGRTFRVAGRSIAVFRARAGELYAVDAECPHAGGPLGDGLIGDGKVVCPLHGYAFALDSGEPIDHTCPRLGTYAVRVAADGAVLVEIPAPSPV